MEERLIMKIIFENITKHYDKVKALDNINFEVNEGELIALLGPSGCGKTTLLRIIAGLLNEDMGKILVDNKDITKLTPQERNTALVFQNYALFPHMTVWENVAYGLKVRKINKVEIEKQVNEILDKVGLKEYWNRKIQHLSGGQQQRVALGRALVIKPNLLLFDEPLSNLDEKLRISMREEIKSIQRELGITSIYVTHDQEEALSIADRIVVMDKGEIQQIGTPMEIYHRPNNEFVANFIGQANIIQATIEKTTKGYRGNILGKDIYFHAVDNIIEGNVKALLRPEEMYFESQGLPGIVVNRMNLGNIVRYTVKLDENQDIIVDVMNRFSQKIYNVGEKVYIDFDERGVHLC